MSKSKVFSRACLSFDWLCQRGERPLGGQRSVGVLTNSFDWLCQRSERPLGGQRSASSAKRGGYTK